MSETNGWLKKDGYVEIIWPKKKKTVRFSVVLPLSFLQKITVTQ
jgi:hypothetical protein